MKKDIIENKKIKALRVRQEKEEDMAIDEKRKQLDGVKMEAEVLRKMNDEI